MVSRAPFLIALATTGCMNEYHPEYHPVTTTTFVQNVSAPTTVVNGDGAAPHESPENTLENTPVAQLPRATHREPASASHAEPHVEHRGETTARIPPAASCPLASADPGDLRERCRNGDDDACKQLSGIHLGGNVRIGGGVVFNGDVYVHGDLVLGTRPGEPLMITR